MIKSSKTKSELNSILYEISQEPNNNENIIIEEIKKLDEYHKTNYLDVCNIKF